jgi:preprotein translocase subunit SecF
MKLRPLFFTISFSLIMASLLAIIFWNFKISIDFTGGTVWEIQFSEVKEKNDIVNIFEENNIDLNSITSTGLNSYQLKFHNIDQDTKLKLEESLFSLSEETKELRFETLGPILGKELLHKTIYAIILSSLALVWFIASKFKDWTFGVSALLANFHDVIIIIGSFSVLGHFFGAEIDSLFVTALLTILSLSVYDTVVTFDRIRELKRQNFKIEWVPLSNKAVTETLARSINTSVTSMFTLAALIILGGASTRWFATALLIGFISGTYSSIGVAIPLVLFFKRISSKLTQKIH